MKTIAALMAGLVLGAAITGIAQTPSPFPPAPQMIFDTSTSRVLATAAVNESGKPTVIKTDGFGQVICSAR